MLCAYTELCCANIQGSGAGWVLRKWLAWIRYIVLFYGYKWCCLHFAVQLQTAEFHKVTHGSRAHFFCCKLPKSTCRMAILADLLYSKCSAGSSQIITSRLQLVYTYGSAPLILPCFFYTYIFSTHHIRPEEIISQSYVFVCICVCVCEFVATLPSF